jgi:class 3 adenylate cyclase
MDSAAQRSLEELLDFELPAEVWSEREYTSIYCAVLFADLENSVQISRIISPEDYDSLIDEFQKAMLQAADELQEKLQIRASEVAVAGDQLAVFFYDEASVKRNYLLDYHKLAGDEREAIISNYKHSNQELAFKALQAAVYLKNSWLINPVNVERVVMHREPYGLALGVHIGKVFLRTRPDGRRRIEGYTVNMAKRVESYSRHGKFSRIMFSQAAANLIRGTIRQHTQLRQRIFFHHHDVGPEVLKGLGRTDLYELKFYHRIGQPRPPEQLVQLYKRIFAVDETNSWAYSQLVDYYHFIKNDLKKVSELAQRAYLVYPRDEKVLLDLAKCFVGEGMLEQAKAYCLQALAINPEFDVCHEVLGLIYDRQNDLVAAAENARRALLLSPGSPMNQLNMGLALSDIGQYTEAASHIADAIRQYPQFLTDQPRYAQVLESLRRLEAVGAMNDDLRALFARHLPEAAAGLAGAEQESPAASRA